MANRHAHKLPLAAGIRRIDDTSFPSAVHGMLRDWLGSVGPDAPGCTVTRRRGVLSPADPVRSIASEGAELDLVRRVPWCLGRNRGRDVAEGDAG